MTGRERVERRLAAIFAADVVGFSSMMERDEEGTLTKIKALQQEIVRPTVEKHHGRVVKTTGDGFLIEFAGPVEAVRCAISVQDALTSGPIRLRIGINLGDIIIEPDGDVYGDGVNIAARLEGLADPGGVCISGAVYDQIEGKIEAAFESRGEQQVKNISRPVRVYALSGWNSTTGHSEPKALPVTNKPSIAVMPFVNMSGDLEQAYFSQGIVEDIIAALHRVKWLFVISRSSTAGYQGRSVDLKQVGRELGVRYVLEGSVRKAANRVRITGQLTEAASGRHVWADRFEGSLEDIFELQDRITESVVGAVEPTIRLVEVERANAKPTESLDAYDLYLRALPLHYSNNRDRMAEAQGLLARAIDIDPNYSLAKAFSALTTVIQTNQGWTGEVEQKNGVRLAREALVDHRDDPVTLRCTGHSLSYLAHEYDTGVALLERALTLHPNSAEVHHSAGWVWNFACNGSRALEHFHRAMRLSPLDPEMGHTLIGLTFAQLLAGRSEEALETSRRAMAAMPTSISPLRAAIMALVELGRIKEAKGLGLKLLGLVPEFRVAEFHEVQPFKDDTFVERYMAALRFAELPE